MSSPWTLVGNVVKLDDEGNRVRVGPPVVGSSAPKLEVSGNIVATQASTIPLQDKGGNVFDVKAYGAKGDRTTDDRGPIQDAIDAMPATGGTLYFPPGNYRVSKDPNPSAAWAINIVDKAVLIRGAGPDATILTIDHPTASTIRTDFTQGSSTDRELYMEVRDLKFEVETGVTKTAGAAILQECTGFGFQNTFTVRNCWFLGCFDGIRLTNAGSAVIKHCQILSCLHAAIFLSNKRNEQLPGADVGTVFIADNWIWERPHDPALVTYGILATTGASGLRIHHNSFLNFNRPVYMNLQSGQIHSTIHIDHNSFDGGSSGVHDPKLWITGQGGLQKIDVSSNDFSIDSDTGVGIQVDVSTSTGKVFNGTISGNTFNGDVLGPSPFGKGIVLNPGVGATCKDLVVSGNFFDLLPTGIEVGPHCSQIHVADNYFAAGGSVTTPLVNNDPSPLGAFFPDRVGVGRVNDVTAGGATVVKEIYAYSGQAFRPRVYLQGVAGTSSPGIDFAFDHTNTRRAGIVATATGSAGVQLELFTKPDSAAIQRRAVLDRDGNVLWKGTESPPGTWVEGLFQEMPKLSANPAAPAASRVRFYARANASNKLEFCVRFPGGAIVVIATEP